MAAVPVIALILYLLGVALMFGWTTGDDKPSWWPYAIAIALLWPLWAMLYLYDNWRPRT